MNHVICKKISGTGDVKENEPDSERQISHAFSHMQNLDRN
jgi:hypothetical protein